MEETALRDRVRAAEADIANGRPDRALAHCQALQARYPRALNVQRLLGEVYLAMNRPDDALRAMERVLAADPDDARACCARAIAHQMRGDRSTALTWYRRACEIRPDDNMLRQAYRELATPLGQTPYRLSSAALARLYQRGDLFLHAEHEWQSVLSREPDRLDALLGLAETYWRLGDATRTENVVRRVLAQAPDCVKGLLILAALEQTAGRQNEAQHLLQQAAELDPERRMGRVLYAELVGAGDRALGAMLLKAAARADGADLDSSALPAFGSGQASTGVFETAWAGAAPRSGSLPMATQEDLAAVSSLANSRSGALPPDFHSIFAETEFMLWGRDDDDAAAPVVAAPAPAAPSTPLLGAELPIDDQLERARPTSPPPDFGRPDGGLEDTESRAAVGWVQWLQALGAKPLDHGQLPERSLPAFPDQRDQPMTIPTPMAPFMGPPMASAPSGSLRDAFAGFSSSDLVAGGAPAYPMPPADADGLPGASFDGGQSATEPATDYPPAWGAPASEFARDGGSWHDVASGEQSRGWGAEQQEGDAGELAAPATDAQPWGGASEGAAWAAPEPATAAPSWGPASAPDRSGQPDVPVTLEALQQRLTNSGFEPYEPRPGALAALGRQPGAVSSGPSDGSGAMAQRHDTSADGVTLEQARALSARGQIEDALAVYASLLRETPEQASVVIDDLRTLSAQSDDSAVYRLLGDAYIHGGNYEQALEAYNQAQARNQPDGA